jgi:hypothetical protein
MVQACYGEWPRRTQSRHTAPHLSNSYTLWTTELWTWTPLRIRTSDLDFVGLAWTSFQISACHHAGRGETQTRHGNFTSRQTWRTAWPRSPPATVRASCVLTNSNCNYQPTRQAEDVRECVRGAHPPFLCHTAYSHMVGHIRHCIHP